MNFPYLKQEFIEGAAESLLSRAVEATRLAPPIDLDALLFDYLAEVEGLSFNDRADLSSVSGGEVIGAMYPKTGRIEIARELKVDGPLGRYRFTVAHEIGHWVLHRPLCLHQDQSLDLFGPADVPERLVSLQRDVFPARGVSPPPEEWQANTFAAFLLMPPALLRAAVVERFGEPPLKLSAVDPERLQTAYDTARFLARATDATHPQSLADAFGVSVQATAIALTARGYVSDSPTLL